MSDETTNERISRLGFSAEPAGQWSKDLLDANGRLLMSGSALEVSRWLDGFEYARSLAPNPGAQHELFSTSVPR